MPLWATGASLWAAEAERPSAAPPNGYVVFDSG